MEVVAELLLSVAEAVVVDRQLTLEARAVVVVVAVEEEEEAHYHLSLEVVGAVLFDQH
jgi:hypothetical protein